MLVEQHAAIGTGEQCERIGAAVIGAGDETIRTGVDAKELRRLGGTRERGREVRRQQRQRIRERGQGRCGVVDGTTGSERVAVLEETVAQAGIESQIARGTQREHGRDAARVAVIELQQSVLAATARAKVPVREHADVTAQPGFVGIQQLDAGTQDHACAIFEARRERKARVTHEARQGAGVEIAMCGVVRGQTVGTEAPGRIDDAVEMQCTRGGVAGAPARVGLDADLARARDGSERIDIDPQITIGKQRRTQAHRAARESARRAARDIDTRLRADVDESGSCCLHLLVAMLGVGGAASRARGADGHVAAALIGGRTGGQKAALDVHAAAPEERDAAAAQARGIEHALHQHLPAAARCVRDEADAVGAQGGARREREISATRTHRHLVVDAARGEFCH